METKIKTNEELSTEASVARRFVIEGIGSRMEMTASMVVWSEARDELQSRGKLYLLEA